MNIRSRLHEGLVVSGLILAMVVILMLVMPHGRFMLGKFLSGLAFVVAMLSLYFLPIVIGYVHTNKAFDWYDKINPQRQMGSGEKFFIVLIASVFMFFFWGVVIQIAVNYPALEYQLRVNLNQATDWELFPWGWGAFGAGMFLLGSTFSVSFASKE